jgi:hypothetical protein
MNALTGKKYAWCVATIYLCFSLRELISIEKCSPTKPKPRRGFILVLVFVRDMRDTRDTRDFRDMTILFTKIKKIIVKIQM